MAVKIKPALRILVPDLNYSQVSDIVGPKTSDKALAEAFATNLVGTNLPEDPRQTFRFVPPVLHRVRVSFALHEHSLRQITCMSQAINIVHAVDRKSTRLNS